MFEYIIETYKVPAELGREIMYNRKDKGIITKDLGNYIGVEMYENPGKLLTLHPTWNIHYLDTFGKLPKSKNRKSKQRYQDYLRADWFDGSFADWIGVKKINKNNKKK